MRQRSSSAITPYSAVNELGAHTSALLHFFQCLETSGTSIIDVAGGLVWDLAGSPFGFTFNPALRSVATNMLGTSVPVAMRSGTFRAVNAAKHHLMMAVVRPYSGTTARVAFGDNNGLLFPGAGAGFGMAERHTAIGSVALGAETYERQDGGIYADGAGQDLVVYAYHKPNVSMTYDMLNINSGASVWTGINPTESLQASWGDITFSPCMRFSSVELMGVALYQFTSQPPDLMTGILWNGAAWRAGNRSSYPLWRNRT